MKQLFILLIVSVLCGCVKNKKRAAENSRPMDLIPKKAIAQQASKFYINVTDQFLEDVKSDFAVAYTFNHPLFEDESEIIWHGKLNPSAEKPGTLMNADQLARLVKTIFSAESYGGSPNKCYEPRMGIVFYNKDSAVKGYVSICFTCNSLTSNPKMRILSGNIRKGFSSKGREKLESMCEELHLGACRPKH